MADGKSTSMDNLILACRQGEEWAWAELLIRISPVIFSICRDNRLSQEESFDVFGEICYLMVRNIEQIHSSDKVFAYVGTITRRQIYDRYHRDRSIDFVDSTQLDATPGDPDHSPDHLYEESDRRQILYEALSALPQRDYELLQSLYFDENEPTYEEIARRLRMPVPSIGPTRARALKKLERILRRMGYNFEVF